MEKILLAYSFRSNYENFIVDLNYMFKKSFVNQVFKKDDKKKQKILDCTKDKTIIIKMMTTFSYLRTS